MPDLKNNLHSHGWLVLINAMIAMFISLRYFEYLPGFPADALSVSFIAASVWSQMTLLSAIVGLITIPLLLLPRLAYRVSIAAFSSFFLVLLVVDTFVFAQYRFHMNEVVLSLVFSGDVVDFPLISWMIVSGGVLLVFALEYWLVKKLYSKPVFTQRTLGRKFTYVTVIMLLFCNGAHVWAAANAYQPINIVKQYLPLFKPATANSFMKKHGWLDEEAVAREEAMALSENSSLNYPVSPLQTGAVNKPVNIMFLIVDSWRFDTFNEENTPNLWTLAQKGERFENHLSSGNATRTGIFGLFYGLPGTYWHSVLANNKAPVFLDRLKQLEYQIGVFASAKLTSPEFDQTVFSNIENLRLYSQGKTAPERDINLTESWQSWYEKRDRSKPLFSFLFFDSPHAYDFPDDYPDRYQPLSKQINYLSLDNQTNVKPIMNRYKTSVRFVDSLAKQVIDTLEEAGDLEDTLIIITGDHSQEFNDNKLNYWGHNSNYTFAQTHVPFAIVGPHVPGYLGADWRSELTSHQDIAPTLMENYLGVTSPVSDYSTGLNLFSGVIDRPWVLVSSYSGYGLVTQDSILEVGATGQSRYLDLNNRPKEGGPNFKVVEKALKQISRFRK